MRHTLFDRLRVSASVGDYHPVGEELDTDTDTPDSEQVPPDTEAEFGGREARLNLERKLLRKLATRMSILVLIYILNYVRLPLSLSGFVFRVSSHLRSQVDRNNIS
jgi:hypothetical protein